MPINSLLDISAYLAGKKKKKKCVWGKVDAGLHVELAAAFYHVALGKQIMRRESIYP